MVASAPATSAPFPSRMPAPSSCPSANIRSGNDCPSPRLHPSPPVGNLGFAAPSMASK
jgi:hypothetical protein